MPHPALRALALATPLLLVLAPPSRPAAAQPIRVVAAETVYGDIARQLGGPEVAVTSILSNPDADPHLFEASPSVARALAAARLVVANGAGYDPWMDKLLRASPGVPRTVLTAAALGHHKDGDNPHVWYDTATVLALAAALSDALSTLDPPHAPAFAARLAAFRTAMQPVEARIAALRTRLEGTPVAATEPVFGYMLDALGLQTHGAAFQLAVMNGTEPAASDIAAFEDGLRRRRVRLLVFNRQASSPAAERMARLAREARIPILGVTETAPPGKTYQAWILDELDALGRALP